MGKFRRIAEKLAGLIEDHGTVTAEQLPIIVGDILGGGVGSFNCYPGKPGGCHDLAVFISLNCKAYAIGKYHLKFDTAIKRLLKHVWDCPNTKSAVFITDSWYPWTIDEERKNLKEVQRRIDLEIYFVAAGNINEIVLKL